MMYNERGARLLITLDDIEPQIWRRVEVPLAMSLKGLHDVIQAVMLFEDYHLFEFEADGRFYDVPDPAEDFGRKTYAAKNIRIRTLIDRGITTFAYTYDFGDNWRHTVVVESVEDADPRRCCMDGCELLSAKPFRAWDILMPHKFNESRRHKIAKQKFKVTNWPAYNESLRRRGDLTVWISDEALCLWSASRRTSRGGQPKYSDLAITMCLTLRIAFDLPLRQTQGLMRSVATLMGVDIAVPDFSTLSRRGKGLVLPPVRRPTASPGPVHLVVDSTGLKVFGEGEWLENKHKVKVKRKRWRKLHLGLDLISGEIICSQLTTDDVGDPTVLPDLLDQVENPVSRFLADGAYDGAPTRELLADRLGEIVEVIIPPPRTAVESPQSEQSPTMRDRHIAEIKTKGRIAWQKSSGYNQRSRVETQMGRWKAVTGPNLKSRHLDNQITEANIAVRVLNRMTELGRPEFRRVA